jgi:hypothetical protein
MAILRDEKGRWLPGVSPNPSGRPPIKVSLVKLLQDRLSNESTADEIIQALIDKCKERDVPAIKEVLDRIDGKVATELNVKSLVVHVGDEYAQTGLEANRKQMEEYRMRYLEGE